MSIHIVKRTWGRCDTRRGTPTEERDNDGELFGARPIFVAGCEIRGENSVRTHVTLDSMGALVEGVHENPFELLGPHPVEHDGRTALAVRAYLPDKQQAWVLDPTHQASHPMRRIHPAGLFERSAFLFEHRHRVVKRCASTPFA